MTTIADGFVSDTLDEYEALTELLELIHSLEDRGPICELHEEKMPALQGLSCDLCVHGRSHTQQAERDVLAAVRTAVRQFTTIPTISTYVPNVGTNIATALPTATDETAVAAVPGRLHTIRGQIHVPSDPEFGTSQHVARTIMAVVGQIKNGLVMLVTLTLGIVAMVAATNIVAFFSFIPFIGLVVPLLLIGGLVIAFFPMYYLFPEIDVEPREVLPGVLFGAIGWAVLQVLFQVYVSLAGSDSNLIASILLLVTWLYFSAVILLLGAVVNAVLIGRANEIVETGDDPSTQNIDRT